MLICQEVDQDHAHHILKKVFITTNNSIVFLIVYIFPEKPTRHRHRSRSRERVRNEERKRSRERERSRDRIRERERERDKDRERLNLDRDRRMEKGLYRNIQLIC